MKWQLLKSLNAQEAKKVRPEILNTFWEKRIESHTEQSIDLIKGFIKGRPPTHWNHLPVDRDQWSSVVDTEFQQIVMNHDKKAFLKLFEHVSDIDILGIDKGEGFNLAKQNAPKEDVIVALSSNDERDIIEYMADMDMSAAVSVFSEGKTSTLCTVGNDDKSIFSIHSVGKIFTGLLVLRLVEQGILKEEDLMKPIQISESAKAKLPDSVVERLKDVTLHDVMVHQGGFGDFVGNYVRDVKSSLEHKTELPKIESLDDFLLYANNELSEHGKTRYSNLGSLLVGLATEHAYAEHQKIHSEHPHLDFNKMLQEFIQKPSGIAVLTDRSPDGAKVNTSTIIAEPTPEAPYLVANPSGGYWTSISDLQKLGEWLYSKSQETDFSRLLLEYGQEFHLDSDTLGHKGENPSASAMLSVSLSNGRIIAALSNSSRTAAHDLEETIRENIFTRAAIDPSVSPFEGHQDNKLAPISPQLLEDELLAAREKMKQFKEAMPNALDFIVSQEEVVKTGASLVTPLNTLPKPPGAN